MSGRGVEVPELVRSRDARVGSLDVRRAIPTRARRNVGAWCFADHLGPTSLRPGESADVAPHPHIGLQTVTWLFQGAFVHRDSLGSEQIIRPGQLNLMSAGRGIAHSEEDPGQPEGVLHGIQLWLAQPEATRWSAPAFEHHDELAQYESSSLRATILVGELVAARSRARRDAEVVGAQLRLAPGVTVLPVRREFEHAVVGITGEVALDPLVVGAGATAYLAPGRDEVVMVTHTGATVMLLGGTPLAAPPVMWWNFVARSRDEIVEAWRSWSERDERFGRVDSRFAPIDSPAPAWLPHNHERGTS